MFYVLVNPASGSGRGQKYWEQLEPMLKEEKVSYEVYTSEYPGHLFSQIKEYMNTGKMQDKPSIDELIAMMIRHAKMQIDFKGEFMGMREMRKHVGWYTTGYPNSTKLRAKANEMEKLDDLVELLEVWRESIHE